jgi:thiamine biosynthesis protein ThiS
MILSINGRRREVPAAAAESIIQLLEHLKLEPEKVVVERNRKILTAEQFAVTALEENDVLELIRFVGGG